MSSTRVAVIAFLAASVTTGSAQAPRPGAPGGPPQNRLRAAQVMALTGPWPDGSAVPIKYTQAGGEVSPALTWSQVPDGVTHFVLIVHDLDALSGNGPDDVLHWMVWNIPGSATALSEGVPQGPTRPDGSRQISATGPNYRGPAAPASGPAHHYAFELYALDAPVNVPQAVQSPSDTRAAVMAAIAGHIRAKAVYLGLFKRP